MTDPQPVGEAQGSEPLPATVNGESDLPAPLVLSAEEEETGGLHLRTGFLEARALVIYVPRGHLRKLFSF